MLQERGVSGLYLQVLVRTNDAFLEFFQIGTQKEAGSSQGCKLELPEVMAGQVLVQGFGRSHYLWKVCFTQRKNCSMVNI